MEGFPPFTRAMLEEKADVSVFESGEHYLVLLANAAATDNGGQRDISLLAFTKEGAPVSDAEEPAPTLISEHSGDERFPVGVAIDKSSFGVTWVRNGELVVQPHHANRNYRQNNPRANE